MECPRTLSVLGRRAWLVTLSGGHYPTFFLFFPKPCVLAWEPSLRSPALCPFQPVLGRPRPSPTRRCPPGAQMSPPTLLNAAAFCSSPRRDELGHPDQDLSPGWA